VREAPELMRVELQGVTGAPWALEVTPRHPIYVPSHGGYIDVEDLQVGTVVRLEGGARAEVVSLGWLPGEEVYNLEVEGWHNYFAEGVLVHNGKYGKKPPKGGGGGAGGSCPRLPPNLILDAGDVVFRHYYFGNDHGPAHAHVYGGGETTRIGPLGKPAFPGDPELSQAQRRAYNRNRTHVRRCINKIGRWLLWNKHNG